MEMYQKVLKLYKNGMAHIEIYRNCKLIGTETWRRTHKSTYRSDIAQRAMRECRSTPMMRKIDLRLLADKLLEHRLIKANEKKEITGEKTVTEGMDRLVDIMISSSRSIGMSGEVFRIFLELLRGRDTKRTSQLADQLLQKYESLLFDHDAKQQAQFDDEAVAKWLKEGTVNLNVKRVQMLGVPGSGKTCSQRLLLNEDPPKGGVTDSTPIACRAVKASRISFHDGCMERVGVHALLSRLACDFKETAEKIKQDTMSKEESLEKPKEESLEMPKEEFSEMPKAESSGTFSTDSSNEAKSTKSADDPHSNSICKEIFRAIPKAEANLNCNWIYIVDSGGQTAFQELLPLFTRPASLNIITIDLSKGMNEKLDLQYRIHGKSFPCDPNFLSTNIEFIKDVLSSGAILQLYRTPKSEDEAASLQYPEYFVLGTHKDDKKVTPEKIAEFNEALSSLTSGSEEKGYRIIPAVQNGDIIYQINTMLEPGPERQAEAKKLCDTIFDDTSDNTCTFEMPVRWFAFELTLQEKAGNESYLKMDDVLSIGRSLQMTKNDIKLALKHLHNVTIILYYPQVLPDIVFVDPHPILDILSRLLALTYKIDAGFLRRLTKPRPLDSELNDLKKRGIFNTSLLNKLKDDHEFLKSDFIKLLLHLHIIVDTEDGYFIPSALPSYLGQAPESDIINPLLIVWQNPVNEEILPVPRGIFPLAIVNLMKLNQPQFQFPPMHQTYLRYRDAMSFRVLVDNEHIGTVHFIKKHRHIEIHFIGQKDDTKYCPLIFEAVTEAINSSSVAINLKPTHKLAFSCSSTENCYCIVTNEAEERVACTLCPKRAIISKDEKYWTWFHVTHQSSTEANDASCTLDITCLRDVRSLLREGNFFESKWLDLGDHLGLLPDTLNVIETNHSDVSRRLRETLVKWLEGADNASPSWRSLIKALENIEDNNVAGHIRCTRIKRKAT